MANKTDLKKKKSKVRGSRYFTPGDARACLFIHLSKPPNCLTEFTELTRTPSRKYIYFWKAMINTAAKRNLVQLCYYITREFSSAFSRINRQTSETSIPTEKCFKLAQKPCGRVVKRKYNLNGINTALCRALSMKTLHLF